MRIAFIIILIGFLQDVPNKPSEDFQIDIDYKFKARTQDRNTVHVSESQSEQDRRALGTTPLPFLTINLIIKNLGENEIRVRAMNNEKLVLFSRKAELNEKYPMEIGFMDDIKDGLTPREFNIQFLTDKRKEVSRIHMIIQDDGTFLVNNEVRGKF